jgi:hypothetical protein
MIRDSDIIANLLCRIVKHQKGVLFIPKKEHMKLATGLIRRSTNLSLDPNIMERYFYGNKTQRHCD